MASWFINFRKLLYTLALNHSIVLNQAINSPKNVRARLCHLSVDDSAILKGFAFTRYGTLCPTSLDLNKHLTNENGLLKKKRDGNFSWTAKNVHLDDSWTFCLDLMDYHKRWNEGIQCWELMDRWVSINDDGSLVMEDPYVLFLSFLLQRSIADHHLALVPGICGAHFSGFWKTYP
jgi:hypothetical protein